MNHSARVYVQLQCQRITLHCILTALSVLTWFWPFANNYKHYNNNTLLKQFYFCKRLLHAITSIFSTKWPSHLHRHMSIVFTVFNVLSVFYMCLLTYVRLTHIIITYLLTY